jgi:hypothetical protein
MKPAKVPLGEPVSRNCPSPALFLLLSVSSRIRPQGGNVSCHRLGQSLAPARAEGESGAAKAWCKRLAISLREGARPANLLLAMNRLSVQLSTSWVVPGLLIPHTVEAALISAGGSVGQGEWPVGQRYAGHHGSPAAQQQVGARLQDTGLALDDICHDGKGAALQEWLS